MQLSGLASKIGSSLQHLRGFLLRLNFLPNVAPFNFAGIEAQCCDAWELIAEQANIVAVYNHTRETQLSEGERVLPVKRRWLSKEHPVAEIKLCQSMEAAQAIEI